MIPDGAVMMVISDVASMMVITYGASMMVIQFCRGDFPSAICALELIFPLELVFSLGMFSWIIFPGKISPDNFLLRTTLEKLSGRKLSREMSRDGVVLLYLR